MEAKFSTGSEYRPDLQHQGKTDLYYKTRAEAEEEQALLREKFANGELTLGTILGPGQVKDAQQALELLAEHKLNTSLLNAARAIVSLNPDQFKDAFQALELIKDNGSEISLVEAANLAIEQRKARMIGIPTKDLLIKYKEQYRKCAIGQPSILPTGGSIPQNSIAILEKRTLPIFRIS